MNTHSTKPVRLEGKIFKTLCAFSVVIIVIFALIASGLYFFASEKRAEEGLGRSALETAAALDTLSEQQQKDLLQTQISSQERYTLIAPDGRVVYDSYQLAEELENHADRPEVTGALETGSSSVVRYSETLQTDTLYTAVKLSDGSVIRLAETRSSLLNLEASLLVPLVLILVLIVVAVFVLSRILTKWIMRPIEALDVREPLEHSIYEEMDPLLERITRQHALLKKQNEELLQTENIRREFSANVSHEMKTPLQVISGYAELLKNGMVASKDKEQFAGLIYEEAQAMRLLIDDVLTLSSLDESVPQEKGKQIDLLETAQRMAGRLESFAASHEVALRVEGKEARLLGNEILIEEIFYNLIENGIRYNKEQGEVVVTISPKEELTVVTVKDTGAGIPADHIDKIFERFFRVDKSRSKETGGTGLGLAIVKHAVLYHGGTIKAESELGEGTLFTITFSPSPAAIS